MTLEEALRRYYETFDKAFPIMILNVDDEKNIRLIEKAIRTGKPYELPEDDSDPPLLY